MTKEAGVIFDRKTAEKVLDKCGLVKRIDKGGNYSNKLNSGDSFWAEVTDSVEGSSGVWKHAWKVKSRNGESWEDIFSDVSGTEPAASGTTDDGYLINPDGSKLPNGSIVRIKHTPIEVGSGSDAVLTDSYTVVGGGSGTLPTGQYQFQGYYMTTQNGAGWDFPRAHQIIE